MKKYFLLILFLFLMPQLAHLQTKVEEKVFVNFSNQFPVPNEEISVYIESYQTDINRATISWIIDGVLVEQGPGLKDFILNSGNLGEQKTLTIKIEKQGGGVIEKQYLISPVEVDLYYEGITSTHPFYAGRPEATQQSDIKFVALPNILNINGNKIPDDKISYTWEINGYIDQKNSGVAKNTYYYEADILPKKINVSLVADAIESNQTAKTTQTISPTDPTISLYENNPIYGIIFEQSISDGYSNRDEIEVVANPYGFDKDVAENGVFSWILNNQKVENFKSKNIIFRKIEEGESNNFVSVEISHKEKFLQKAKRVFNLNFENNDNEFNF